MSAHPPNVLLLVLDSVRAGNMSLHGHDNNTTPFLESFAAETTVYEQARSPATGSVASHASMFTGLHAREHGVTHRRHRLRTGETIWDRLGEEGYATGVFSNNPFLTEIDVGLRDPFDEVVGRDRELPYPEGINPKEFVVEAGEGPKKYLTYLRMALTNDSPLGSLINGVAFKSSESLSKYLPEFATARPDAVTYADHFLEWSGDQDSPWAACVNFMDAHYPYEPLPEYDAWGGSDIRAIQDRIEDQRWEFVGGRRPWGERRAIESLYDGAIRQMDEQIRRIVHTLKRRDVHKSTLLIITADHGECFGERSRVQPDIRVVGHGYGLHERLIHVPLIVSLPGVDEGEKVTEPATPTRFPRVVTDILEGERGRASFCPRDGPVIVSTSGISSRAADMAHSFGVSDPGPITAWGDAVIRQDDGRMVRKFVRLGDRGATVAIYDAQSSWRVSRNGSEEVDRVIDHLEDAEVRIDTSGDVDQELQQRLEDLGYA